VLIGGTGKINMAIAAGTNCICERKARMRVIK
jgi:hypothetical protein